MKMLTLIPTPDDRMTVSVEAQPTFYQIEIHEMCLYRSNECRWRLGFASSRSRVLHAGGLCGGGVILVWVVVLFARTSIVLSAR